MGISCITLRARPALLQVVYHPRHAHADFLLDPAWQDVLLGAVEGLLAQGEEAGSSDPPQPSASSRSEALGALAAGAAAAEPAAAEEGKGGALGAAAATAPSLDELLAGDGGVDGWRRFLEAAAGRRVSSGAGAAAAADSPFVTTQARQGGLVVSRKPSTHQPVLELLAAQLSAGSSAAAGEASAQEAGAGMRAVPRRHTLPVAAPSHLLDAATVSSEVAGILRRASELSQLHD
jgi:hypothetical protein